MASIDPKQAERVWSRVMNVQKQPPEACAPSIAAQTYDAMLKQALREARDDSADFSCMEKRLCGCGKKLLRQILALLQCEEKLLGALYFLQTGKKACCGARKEPCITCIAETLRIQYEKADEAAAKYRNAAAQYPAHACSFEKLAKQKCVIAEKILCILQNCL